MFNVVEERERSELIGVFLYNPILKSLNYSKNVKMSRLISKNLVFMSKLGKK